MEFKKFINSIEIFLFCLLFGLYIRDKIYVPDFESYKNNLETTLEVNESLKEIIFDSIVYENPDYYKYAYKIKDIEKIIVLDEKLDIEDPFKTKVIITDLKLNKSSLDQYIEIPAINYKEDINTDLDKYNNLLQDSYNLHTNLKKFTHFIYILAGSFFLASYYYCSEKTFSFHIKTPNKKK